MNWNPTIDGIVGRPTQRAGCRRSVWNRDRFRSGHPAVVAWLGLWLAAAGLAAAQRVGDAPANRVTDTVPVAVKDVRFDLPVTHGLILHFAADTIENLTDNDPVDLWHDRSGQANHAVQATASSQPRYHEAVLDGRAIVRFGGGEKFLRHAAVLTADYTAAYVLKPSESAVNLLYYYHGGNVSGGDLGLFSEARHFSQGWGSYTPAANQITAQQYPTPLTWRIHVHTPSALYQDGQEVVYGRKATVPGGRLTDLGSRSDVATLFFVGDIAEVVVYDRVLTDAERQAVEHYLGAKWLGW